MRHLDTNIVIARVNGSREVDIQITRHYPRIVLSAIVLAELRYGATNSDRPL